MKALEEMRTQRQLAFVEPGGLGSLFKYARKKKWQKRRPLQIRLPPLLNLLGNGGFSRD